MQHPTDPNAPRAEKAAPPKAPGTRPNVLPPDSLPAEAAEGKPRCGLQSGGGCALRDNARMLFRCRSLGQGPKNLGVWLWFHVGGTPRENVALWPGQIADALGVETRRLAFWLYDLARVGVIHLRNVELRRDAELRRENDRAPIRLPADEPIRLDVFFPAPAAPEPPTQAPDPQLPLWEDSDRSDPEPSGPTPRGSDEPPAGDPPAAGTPRAESARDARARAEVVGIVEDAESAPNPRGIRAESARNPRARNPRAETRLISARDARARADLIDSDDDDDDGGFCEEDYGRLVAALYGGHAPRLDQDDRAFLVAVCLVARRHGWLELILRAAGAVAKEAARRAGTPQAILNRLGYFRKVASNALHDEARSRASRQESRAMFRGLLCREMDAARRIVAAGLPAIEAMTRPPAAIPPPVPPLAAARPEELAAGREAVADALGVVRRIRRERSGATAGAVEG